MRKNPSESRPLAGHRRLLAWQLSMQLARRVYGVTESFPRREIYGMAAQLRRAVVSVPANIAEGYGRLHRTEYRQHLGVARGSLREAETLFELSMDLGFVNADDVPAITELLDHVGRLLTRIILRLESSPMPRPRPA